MKSTKAKSHKSQKSQVALAENSPILGRIAAVILALLSILQLLASGIRDIDDLQAAADMPATEFQQTLSMLEITGKIAAQGGGNWTLR